MTDALSRLPKLSRTSLVDEVIGAMRKMLSEEAWASGSKLPSEQELGRQLGVGRSTVREALRVLGHLGLVEARSGLGTYVVDSQMPAGGAPAEPDTPDAVRDLYEFRYVIEVPAARLAAERGAPDDIAAIAAAWERCRWSVEADKPDEFPRLDFVFHLSIVQASGNRFYIHAYRALEAAFTRYVALILAQGPLRSMLNFHDGLIAAIERGDADGAAQQVEENFVETDVRLRLFCAEAGGSA